MPASLPRTKVSMLRIRIATVFVVMYLRSTVRIQRDLR